MKITDELLADLKADPEGNVSEDHVLALVAEVERLRGMSSFSATLAERCVIAELRDFSPCSNECQAMAFDEATDAIRARRRAHRRCP